ncbi:MAG: MOSC domain-containing protein [Chloroflexi bacterium]|nr:MOSC domain-containing protein [Chloroflexota bacterium]
MVRVVSVNVGQPQTRILHDAPDGREAAWTSGIWKFPVAGALHIAALGVSGDGQADTKNHGGPDKAVLGYASSHYPAWRAELPHLDVQAGGFGENLTIDRQDETTVCVGDVYTADDLTLQVTGPRYPCWKVSRRWNQRDLHDRVYALRRTGWYFRVLNEGTIAAGADLTLAERPQPALTIARCFDLIDTPDDFIDAARQLANAPEASAFWRKMANKALASTGVLE